MRTALSGHALSIFFIVLIVAACPGNLPANQQQQIEGLVEDYRPVLATAKQENKGQFLLDKGAQSGIKPGDLFSLVGKGRPIYLPGTKRMLGYEDKVVGKCRIVKVQKDSSLCEVYSVFGNLSPNLKALRFSKMRAAFFLDGRLVSPVFSTYSFEKLLPNLEWIKPARGPLPVPTKSSMEAFGIDLVFELKDDTLHVYGPDMKEISSYEMVPVSGPPLHESQETGHAITVPGLEQAPKTFDFKEAVPVGTLSEKVLQVAVTDLDGDGKQEIIYLLENGIGVAPYRRAGQAIFYRFGDFECPCSFSCFRGWLVLNLTIKGAGLTSKLFSYKKGRLNLVQDEINLWLSFVQAACGQKTPVLMGQEFEKERFRGERIFRLNPTDQGLEYVEQADFPSDFNIDSVASTEVNGTCVILYVSFDGFFKVFGNGSHIWTSLFPVVPERPCCGPQKADFLKIGKGLVFNGAIPGERGRGVSGLYYLSLSDGYRFFRADSHLKGSICGVSMTSKSVIIGVTEETQKGWRTYLYKFPIP